MQVAQERARRRRAAHRLAGAPDDRALDALLAGAGLAVLERCPLPGPVREVYAAGLLGIRAGLAPEWVRWLKAHGLAHHLLHRGNHLYAEGKLYLWHRQEIEAELFAGELFFADLVGAPPTLDGLAAAARVPLACVHAWQAASVYAAQPTSLDNEDTEGPFFVVSMAASVPPALARRPPAGSVSARNQDG